MHAHEYKFDADAVNHHKHKLWGYTDYMVGLNFFHFHYYYGISSYHGHTHYFSGITGFPIKTRNGHIHRIEGVLENNESHEHKYNNYTSEDSAYIPHRLIRHSYI